MVERPIAAAVNFRGFVRPALVVGVAASVLSVLGAFLDTRAFMQAYLAAFFFWLSIALGCVAVLMIQNLTGGYWGAVIRRFLEAGAATLPLMAALFVPVLVGIPILYDWIRPGAFAGIAVPGFKQAYLSVPFFIVRAVVYWAVWIVLCRTLTRWSVERDERPVPGLTIKMRNLSAFGLILFTLTLSFAAFDWLMSLEYRWASSIYGAMVSMGAVLIGFAFVIFMLTLFADRQPFLPLVNPNLLNSLGSLLLAFLMLWAYLAFSQLLLIYAGNLPEEISWYLRRIQDGWVWAGLVIVLFHFVFPFAVLIVRDFKRNRRILGATAAALVIADYVNLLWITRPAFAGSGLTWLDIALPVAIGGLWLAAFAWLLGQRPLVARYDPQLIEGLEAAHE